MRFVSEEMTRQVAADVLARTIWGEARGEGAAGMQAVAAVVLNRVAVARAHGGRFWWGGDIVSVCQKPFQFSCWNRSDPNFKAISAVNGRDIHFATAQRIARRAVIGRIDDATNGATYYHAREITPHWARGATPCATIGRHIFYKLEA